jgi:hypothetical protein
MYLEIKRFDFNPLVPHIPLIEPKPGEASSFSLLFNLPSPASSISGMRLQADFLEEQCLPIFQAFPGKHEGMNACRAEDEAGKGKC